MNKINNREYIIKDNSINLASDIIHTYKTYIIMNIIKVNSVHFIFNTFVKY